MAIHGVVVKKDGTKVEITVGEEESDPIFYISDLLPHLAKDQVNKTLGEGIPGEKLNVIIGSTPYDQSADGGVKLHMMQILNEKSRHRGTGIPVGRAVGGSGHEGQRSGL